jgi:hypothetical protein
VFALAVAGEASAAAIGATLDAVEEALRPV